MPTYHKYLFLFLLLLSGTLSAQQELQLYQQPQLWHANTLNPSFFPEGKHFCIGLPGLSVDARHSGDISYNDLFRKGDNGVIIDLGPAIDKLDRENEVAYSQRLETVSLGWKLGNGFVLQAGHAIRLHGTGTYPKSLAEILWNGNAPYIGDSVSIGLTGNIVNWSELSAGLAFRSGDRFSIGGKIKYLSGIGVFNTDDSHKKALVYTSPDIYQLTLSTDYAFQSAFVVTAIDTAGLGFDLETGQLKKSRIFSKNSGVAFDLGLTIKATDRLTLSASALDLGGSIKWKDHANYFHSQGQFTYDGISISGSDIIAGTDSVSFENQLDTLNDIFQFQKTPQEFTSKLPTRAYIGASFKLSERWNFGATGVMEWFEGKSSGALGLGAQWTPLKWLSVGGMYSINERSAANIGLNAQLHIWAAQIYLLSDNIVSAFTPYASPAVNFRLGASLVF